jgi:hypothetical protein
VPPPRRLDPARLHLRHDIEPTAPHELNRTFIHTAHLHGLPTLPCHRRLLRTGTASALRRSAKRSLAADRGRAARRVDEVRGHTLEARRDRAIGAGGRRRAAEPAPARGASPHPSPGPAIRPRARVEGREAPRGRIRRRWSPVMLETTVLEHVFEQVKLTAILSTGSTPTHRKPETGFASAGGRHGWPSSLPEQVVWTSGRWCALR